MKRAKQVIRETKLGDLKKHPRNPNVGNVEMIKESYDEHGFYGTIIAQKSTGYILVGNHRYEGALQQGADTITVAWVDVDDDEAERIMLMDNKAGKDATTDDDILTKLLEDMVKRPRGLEGTGYDAVEEEEVELKNLETKPPPKTAWVLIGIPVVRYGEVQGLVDQLAAIEGSIVQTTANDG